MLNSRLFKGWRQHLLWNFADLSLFAGQLRSRQTVAPDRGTA
jgi:hypothetical protein